MQKLAKIRELQRIWSRTFDWGQSIDDVENVVLVFKDGLGYDPEKLMQSVQGLVGLR